MRRPVCLLILLLACCAGAVVRAAPPQYDFRVVIDVSSSMQKTDSQNLRVAALKLLNGLIPEGSRAGVWTFGKYVDVAVKWGKVDDKWRRQADIDAEKIHSNALQTNIESALARARVGWDKADAGQRRVLLLLTDGQVEVSADPAKNEKSRNRILDESLPALKNAGAEVHAIALADGADEALLKRLALETGGSFAVASSAEQLQKVFFRVFERVSQPDSVEFDGREFRIDKGIREMTLLLFRKSGSQPTILIPPDSPAISAAKPRGARWRSDPGYDLITLKKPQFGTWRIDSDMDPDNRLMVVTELKVEIGGLPAYGSPGDTHRLTAELFKRGKKIRKNSYLRFVDFEIRHVDAEGNEKQYTMSHTSERKDKGQYLYPLEQTLAEGRHRFVVSANSSSFSRSKRFELQVQWPVEVVVEARQPAGTYELRLRAREEYLKADGMTAEVFIEAPDGTREALGLETRGGWMRAIVETRQAGLYRAHLRVSAQNHATEIHDIDLGSVSMLGVYREPAVEAAVEAGPDTAPLESDSGEAGQGVDWRLVGIVVVSVNLSLMLLLLGGWLFLRRRRQQAEALIVDDEELSA